MTKEWIKYKLESNGLHIYDLCNQLGIGRATYYGYCQRKNGLKDHSKDIKKAIRALIKGDAE